MKRFICLVCLVTLLLSACSVTEPTPQTQTYGIYELTFKTRLISNDYVGNDWTFTYTHNGQTVESGYTITQSLEVFTFQSIDVEIRENDTIDDVGTGTLQIAILDGSSETIHITVTETNGSYKGNTALWEITCEVKLVEKSPRQSQCSAVVFITFRSCRFP